MRRTASYISLCIYSSGAHFRSGDVTVWLVDIRNVNALWNVRILTCAIEPIREKPQMGGETVLPAHQLSSLPALLPTYLPTFPPITNVHSVTSLAHHRLIYLFTYRPKFLHITSLRTYQTTYLLKYLHMTCIACLLLFVQLYFTTCLPTYPPTCLSLHFPPTYFFKYLSPL